MLCPVCRKEVGKAKFCPDCGTSISGTTALTQQYSAPPPPVPNVQQVAQQPTQPTIVINNVNTNTNTVGAGPMVKPKNKWVAFLLCLFFGVFGAHKFYEGKIIMGILYLFTLGLCGIGVIIDLIVIFLKPNPYF